MNESAINLSSTYYVYKILSNLDFHFTGSFFYNIKMNIHIFGAPWFTAGRLNFVKSRCAPRVGAHRHWGASTVNPAEAWLGPLGVDDLLPLSTLPPRPLLTLDLLVVTPRPREVFLFMTNNKCLPKNRKGPTRTKSSRYVMTTTTTSNSRQKQQTPDTVNKICNIKEN